MQVLGVTGSGDYRERPYFPAGHKVVAVPAATGGRKADSLQHLKINDSHPDRDV